MRLHCVMRLHYAVPMAQFKEVKESERSAQHIARHGVTLKETREAILERPHWMVSGRGNTTLIYGRTYAGRYLFVVVAPANCHPGAAYIVTARDMTPSEKQTFLRKAR